MTRGAVFTYYTNGHTVEYGADRHDFECIECGVSQLSVFQFIGFECRPRVLPPAEGDRP